MSGFVGMVHLDGSPVDTGLLQALTDFLGFRGPDAQKCWSDGPVGLGHALLQVTSDTIPVIHPVQLADRLWIVADARIDARAELIAKLRAKSETTRSVTLSTPDAELILHAYDLWGDACVEHLLGDFSFAIWDARRRRLFCARDPLGIRLFYYALVGSSFIVSNTLNCIRRHPRVSDRLNDTAIADFLLFDGNQDPSTTSFVDIQRLPPAHVLSLEHTTPSIRRYWELSVKMADGLSPKEACVEHFRELFDEAVADRWRSETAGLLMSGGLDSSTVAASAGRVGTRKFPAGRLQAYTQVFDTLIEDDERRYASLVANTLHIPVRFLESDGYRIFEGADDGVNLFPEPVHSPMGHAALDQLRQAAADSRVLLTGDGGDPAFSSRITVHFRQLFAKGQFGRAFSDATRYLTAKGRFSRLYLRTRWRLFLASRNQTASYPTWLNEDLERQLNLRDRWESLARIGTFAGAVRPSAHAALADSMWLTLFEGYDPGVTRIPITVCHPFFDLRLLAFLLGLPTLPWCSDKQLLREAGRGTLPDAVRLRRKTPLRGDPLVATLGKKEASWVDSFEPVPELERYVVRNRIPAVYGETDSSAAWLHLRPLSLNFWLRAYTR